MTGFCAAGVDGCEPPVNIDTGVDVRLLLVLVTLPLSFTTFGTDRLDATVNDETVLAAVTVLGGGATGALVGAVVPPIGAFATKSLIVRTAESIDFLVPLT